MAEVFLTKEGREEKERYLEYLKNEKRQEVIERLKTAREFGDLSENSEYDAARDDQRNLEFEIEKLEDTKKDYTMVGNVIVSMIFGGSWVEGV